MDECGGRWSLFVEIVVVIGCGSSQQKFPLPDDVFQVSDESALSIYERGPKVGSRSSSHSLRLHVDEICQIGLGSGFNIDAHSVF